LVSQYFQDLYSHLQFNSNLLYKWKLPNWLLTNKDFILNNLLPIGILIQYQIYHDIGKPYCKIYDLDTKKYHFPDHANISSNIYFDITNNNILSTLIKRDMDIHLIKAEQIDSFIGTSELDKQIAISLLLTGLTEIHANAEMFGSLESISFKIKYKQIEKRGKQILKKIGEIK
jgi:hypothetical protein